MASKIRHVLPKLELRKQDRLAGSYPTIARTGDRGRKGNNNIFFDDTDVVMFITSSVVSFPTTLPIASRFLKTGMSSDIQITSSVSRNAIENWIFASTNTEKFVPFSENKLFEQNLDKTSAFYATGSDVGNVGFGFSSNLGSKTQIRLSLPVRSITTWNATTASLMYYNSKRQKWEQVGDLEPPIGKGRKSVSFSEDDGLTRCIDVFADAKLFGAFGNNVISGSLLSNLYTDVFTSHAPKHVKNNILEASLLLSDPSNVTLNGNFEPSTSQVIDMSKLINQPFLLEKMVIDMPIKAGPGWTRDQTRIKKLDYISGTANDTLDIGGPAITIGLMNQLATRTRDVIISGTIIPDRDNVSFQVIEKHPQVGDWNRFVWGFSSYATPAAVVKDNESGFFTGSVTLNMIPAVSNGAITYNDLLSSSDHDGTVKDSYIIAVNPFGRNMSGVPSGRSYVGREFMMPQDTSLRSVNTKLFGQITGSPDGAPYRDAEIYNYEKAAYSPYVLFPNDKVILFASKHRPVATKNIYALNNDIDGPWLLTGSHDVAMFTGTINITLYGSLISQEKEYHDTLNQRLETNEIHEIIGGEPILDDFNVEYTSTHAGSFLSDYLTGSLVGIDSSNVITTGNRKLVADKTDKNTYYQNVEIFNKNLGTENEVISYSDYNTVKKEKFSFQRFIQLASSHERFYDSMVPSLDGIFKADSAFVYGVQYLYLPCSFPSPRGLPVVYINFDINTNDASAQNYDYQDSMYSSNIHWTKSYPFEAKYSTVSRQIEHTTYSRKTIAYGCGYLQVYNNAGNIDEYRAARSLVNHTLTSRWAGETSNFYNITNGVRPDTIVKLVYGFGDSNTYPQRLQESQIASNCSDNVVPSTTNRIFGCTNAPQPRTILHYSGSTTTTCPRTPANRGAVIRGWKYGLINGFAQFSKCIFRHDKFGQFRDMLEQRVDTKFYESTGPTPGAVNVRFVNYKGEQTRPEFTYSSNLHFECSSSLPYFDGDVKNRENPINVSSLELSSVT